MTSPTVVACPACGRRNRVPADASGTPRCGQCRAPLPWIVDAGDADLAAVADRAPLPVLLDLWAPWCGPCRMVSPALEELARRFAGRIKLVKVNIDAAPQTARRFTVQAVPTLMLLDHGRVISRQAGAAPAPALQRWVEEALSEAGRPGR
ncbi:thioredoxin [Blastococcus sp. SYSU DS0510]